MIESRSAAAGELQGERGVRVRRINRDTVVPSQVSGKDLIIKLQIHSDVPVLLFQHHPGTRWC